MITGLLSDFRARGPKTRGHENRSVNQALGHENRSVNQLSQEGEFGFWVLSTSARVVNPVNPTNASNCVNNIKTKIVHASRLSMIIVMNQDNYHAGIDKTFTFYNNFINFTENSIYILFKQKNGNPSHLGRITGGYSLPIYG